MTTSKDDATGVVMTDDHLDSLVADVSNLAAVSIATINIDASSDADAIIASLSDETSSIHLARQQPGAPWESSRDFDPPVTSEEAEAPANRRCQYCGLAFDIHEVDSDYFYPAYQYADACESTCLGCWLGVGPPDIEAMLAEEDSSKG